MSMETLREYVATHTDRTACRCGQCITSGPDKLSGHTADMVFFDVSASNNPDPDTLRKLLQEADLNILLDGGEHSYIEVGGIVGDQGLGLQLMGLGWLLKLWQIMTPKLIGVDGDLAMNMAGAGYVSIIPHPPGSEIIYACRM